MTSVQFLLASLLALSLFVVLANLVVVQYGRGALQSALEQGVRVGSVSGDPGRCVEKVNEVVGQLLGGQMSEGLDIDCEIDGAGVVATAETVFESWTALTPDFEISLTSRSVSEPGR